MRSLANSTEMQQPHYNNDQHKSKSLAFLNKTDVLCVFEFIWRKNSSHFSLRALTWCRESNSGLPGVAREYTWVLNTIQFILFWCFTLILTSVPRRSKKRTWRLFSSHWNNWQHPQATVCWIRELIGGHQQRRQMNQQPIRCGANGRSGSRKTTFYINLRPDDAQTIQKEQSITLWSNVRRMFINDHRLKKSSTIWYGDDQNLESKMLRLTTPVGHLQFENDFFFSKSAQEHKTYNQISTWYIPKSILIALANNFFKKFLVPELFMKDVVRKIH